MDAHLLLQKDLFGVIFEALATEPLRTVENNCHNLLQVCSYTRAFGAELVRTQRIHLDSRDPLRDFSAFPKGARRETLIIHEHCWDHHFGGHWDHRLRARDLLLAVDAGSLAALRRLEIRVQVSTGLRALFRACADACPSLRDLEIRGEAVVDADVSFEPLRSLRSLELGEGVVIRSVDGLAALASVEHLSLYVDHPLSSAATLAELAERVVQVAGGLARLRTLRLLTEDLPFRRSDLVQSAGPVFPAAPLPPLLLANLTRLDFPKLYARGADVDRLAALPGLSDLTVLCVEPDRELAFSPCAWRRLTVRVLPELPEHLLRLPPGLLQLSIGVRAHWHVIQHRRWRVACEADLARAVGAAAIIGRAELRQALQIDLEVDEAAAIERRARTEVASAIGEGDRSKCYIHVACVSRTD